MTAWIDAPASDCEHEPDWLGVKCQHCGIPAEMVTPDELAEHLSAALDTAYAEMAGQLGMFGGCDCDHRHVGPCQDCAESTDVAPCAPLSGGAEGIAEADRYVGSIRNDLKREYARAYLAFLRALEPASGSPLAALGPERPRGLSYLAAQAVRLELLRRRP